MNNIICPSLKYKNYIERFIRYCSDKKISVVLKGSLSNGTASPYSDIDIIVTGRITDSDLNEIIELYDMPIMVNLTEKPKGIYTIVYTDNISVDLDIRETISQEELKDSIVLLKYNLNFIVSSQIKRKNLNTKYLQGIPDWYKTLRLIHRSLIKYLSNKPDIACVILGEVKKNMIFLGFTDLEYSHKFKNDIKYAFYKICDNFEVDTRITVLFESLFKELK